MLVQIAQMKWIHQLFDRTEVIKEYFYNLTGQPLGNNDKQVRKMICIAGSQGAGKSELLAVLTNPSKAAKLAQEFLTSEIERLESIKIATNPGSHELSEEVAKDLAYFRQLQHDFGNLLCSEFTCDPSYAGDTMTVSEFIQKPMLPLAITFNSGLALDTDEEKAPLQAVVARVLFVLVLSIEYIYPSLPLQILQLF